MADRPFQVIEGGGKPEPDAEEVARAEKACKGLLEAVKAGGGYWAMVESGDGYAVSYTGDALEMFALVEEPARTMKRQVLGLSEE